ncbi:MAG: TetR/AcrR family transcriptional regulator [Mycobacterium sp.]|jgi:AcrR family transcriptional regulator|nr:TetR/AcrR family transcriptional regulator [Mycobacterium sp.]
MTETDERTDERQALIEASQQVLNDSARCDFKVRNVCRQARLSTHSFYRHFSGKDELVVALLEREVHALAAQLEAESRQARTATERVWNYVLAELDRAGEFRSGGGFLVDKLNWRTVMTDHPEALERCIAALSAPLVTALADGHANGELRCADPVADARAILYIIRGNALDWPNGSGHTVREDLKRSVVQLISRAIGLPARTDG